MRRYVRGFCARWWRGLLLVVTLLAGMSFADIPASTCDQQVEEQVRQLAEAQLLTATPGLTTGQHLTLLGSALRTQQTRLTIRGNQLDLAERNVAELLEQLRQAGVREQALRAELDALKAKAASAP